MVAGARTFGLFLRLWVRESELAAAIVATRIAIR